MFARNFNGLRLMPPAQRVAIHSNRWLSTPTGGSPLQNMEWIAPFIIEKYAKKVKNEILYGTFKYESYDFFDIFPLYRIKFCVEWTYRN